MELKQAMPRVHHLVVPAVVVPHVFMMHQHKAVTMSSRRRYRTVPLLQQLLPQQIHHALPNWTVTLLPHAQALKDVTW